MAVFAAGGFFTKQSFVNQNLYDLIRENRQVVSELKSATVGVQSSLNVNLLDIKVELRGLKENVSALQQQIRQESWKRSN